eukprot:6119705-Alexandrium_andersonii.AAC.1
MSAGLNLQSLVWLGPTTPEKVQEEFTAYFHASCGPTGDVYLAAGKAEVLEHAMALAAKRRKPLPEGFAEMQQD